MTPDLPPQLYVGARCLVGGKYKGTIRYIGPVDCQSGEWVGIEWDDASRGKHDGSHNGRRYFSCSLGQPSGSFVRLNKLLEAVSFGCTLLEAIQDRYSRSIDEEQAAELFVPAGSGRHVAVELVGVDQVAEHLADLSSLQKASVVGDGVALVGDDGGQPLAAHLASLAELDLTDNLIGNWSFATSLLKALPALRTLNLSRNRMCLPSIPSPSAIPQALSLPSLSTLVLNACGVSWSQAVTVAQQLPSLRELHLCCNGIVSLQLPSAPGDTSQTQAPDVSMREPGSSAPVVDFGSRSSTGDSAIGSESSHTETVLAAAFSRLGVLDLEDNQISDWEQVQLLSSLPTLRSLLLSGNKLRSLQYLRGFTSLSTLLLGSNCIDNWASVDQLDFFPALTDTRLTGNPLLAHMGSAGRYEVIARVGRLGSLNASQVSKTERWDAELNYLRHVTDELAAGKDEPSRQIVLRAHPRFPGLTVKYGALAPSVPRSGAGSSLARSMVELVMSHGGKEIKKKLPVSLTVGRLKLMIEKLLRVKAAQQALLLMPVEGDAGQAVPEDITDEDARELRYFNPTDGTRIEVTESDPVARAEALQRAKRAAADLHQLRMEEQEKMIQQFRVVEKGLMA